MYMYNIITYDARNEIIVGSYEFIQAEINSTAPEGLERLVIIEIN